MTETGIGNFANKFCCYLVTNRLGTGAYSSDKTLIVPQRLDIFLSRGVQEYIYQGMSQGGERQDRSRVDGGGLKGAVLVTSPKFPQFIPL